MPKNTILRALNNIHTHARELPCDDPRLMAFFQYIVGFCDVLMFQIYSKHMILRMIASAYRKDVAYAADELLFRTPVLVDVALVKLLGEGCVQDMCKVLRGAEKLKKLARKYTKVGVYPPPTAYRVSSSMLTPRRTQRITTAIRSLRAFPSAGNFLHDPGHRWVKNSSVAGKHDRG